MASDTSSNKIRGLKKPPLSVHISQHRRAIEALRVHCTKTAGRWHLSEVEQDQEQQLIANERRAAHAFISYRPQNIDEIRQQATYATAIDAGFTDDDERAVLRSIASAVNSPPEIVEKMAYSVPETANLLSVSTDYVWKLVSMGQIPSIKLGKRRLVSKETLYKMLNQPGLRNGEY